MGYHEAYVNGRAVSDAVLAPAVSQFGKRSQIVAYDVTSLLKKGENELVLWTGIGWYQTHNKAVVPGGPYVRAQMDVVADGQQVELHYDDYFLTDSVGFREGLYTDYYIGNGKAGGAFSSKFNYKGYRYYLCWRM